MASLVVVLAVLAGCAASRPDAAEPRRVAADPVAAGFRADAWTGLDRALERHVGTRGGVPGAVLSVGRGGAVVYERAAGRRDVVAGNSVPVERATLFDTASLAKPVATAAAAALLVCRGEMAPADPIGGQPLDRVLRHATGLPAHVDWRDLVRAGADLPLDRALAIAMQTAPRGSPGYSNTGYLLVSLEVERRTGVPLGDFLAAELWRPLGMEHATFRPPRGPGANVARSDRDREPGRPYDPLADYIRTEHPGHDPGHSGLFATASDLTIFCQALLHPGLSSVPEIECVAHYLLDENGLAGDGAGDAVRFAANRGRTPAFERDATAAPRRVLFHTGYTGCLMMLDVESGTSVVLLTNGTWEDPRAWEPLRDAVLHEAARSLGR